MNPPSRSATGCAEGMDDALPFLPVSSAREADVAVSQVAVPGPGPDKISPADSPAHLVASPVQRANCQGQDEVLNARPDGNRLDVERVTTIVVILDPARRTAPGHALHLQRGREVPPAPVSTTFLSDKYTDQGVLGIDRGMPVRLKTQ